jgi:hypothetical protein
LTDFYINRKNGAFHRVKKDSISIEQGNTRSYILKVKGDGRVEKLYARFHSFPVVD